MSAQRIPRGWANRRLMRAAKARQRQRDLDEFWRNFLEPRRLDEATVLGGGVLTTVVPPLIPEEMA